MVWEKKWGGTLKREEEREKSRVEID
jgi:hypothetical protein